jgi:PKD repeat protein
MRRRIFIITTLTTWYCSDLLCQKVEWIDYAYATAGFDGGTGVCTDASGNVYVLGTVSTTSITQGDTLENIYGSNDLVLLKYSAGGVLMWSKILGGSGSDDAGDLTIDLTGHLYASVFIQGTTNIQNDTSYVAGASLQIIQFDTAGNYLRHRAITGSANAARIQLAALDNDTYIAYRHFVEKIDTALSAHWSRALSSTTTTFNASGDIYVNRSGRLVVSGGEFGGSATTVLFDTLTLTFTSSGTNEVFMIVMDTSGSALWGRTLYGASTAVETSGSSAIDDFGNAYVNLTTGDLIIFGGDTLINPVGNQKYTALLKYDASGGELWALGFYGDGGALETMQDLLITADQEVLIAGSTGYFDAVLGSFAFPTGITPFVGKVSPLGAVQWVKVSTEGGGSAWFGALCTQVEGKYVVTGAHTGNGFTGQRFGCYSSLPDSRGIVTALISEDTEPVPEADFRYLFEGGVAYFENQSLNADGIEWDFGDGLGTVVRRNPSHAYPVPGVYHPCLIATNTCGSDTLCQTVFVAGIERVTPSRLANSGYHLLRVTGGFPFSSGTVKFIRSGQPDIIPDTVIFRNARLLQANVLLDNAAIGEWDLVITSAGFSDTLPSAISLEQPDTIPLDVQVLGARKTLINTFWKYQVMVTNASNRTEIGIPVYVSIPPDATPIVQYTELNDSVTRAAVDSFGNFFIQLDTVAGDSVLFMAQLIPFLSPGQTSVVHFLARIPSGGIKTITARVGPSYFDQQNLMDMGLRSTCNFLPSCVQCIMDLAGFIPGVGCATGAFNAGCAIGNNGRGAPTGGARSDVISSTIGAMLSCTGGGLGSLMGKAAADAFEASWQLADLANTANGVSDDCGGKNGCKPGNEDNWTWPNAASLDPNMKTGPMGLTPENYISGSEPLHFAIHFENMDSATAPAREVLILDTLDAAIYDASTLRFTSFSFGDSVYLLDPQDDLFVEEIDLRPSKNIILRVNGWVDSLNNVVAWRFSSFDTLSYDLTTEVDDGFLPPNVNRPEGEGYVAYSINPVSGLPHLHVLANSATITFDANDAIITESFVNTIDRVKPSSQVDGSVLFLDDTTFQLSWSGSDDHSGINAFDLYVTINDTLTLPLYSKVNFTSATLTGRVSDKYDFYTVAHDHAGNTEDQATSPDITINVTGVADPAKQSMFEVYPNPAGNLLNVVFHGEATSDVTVSIVNLLGQVIYSRTHKDLSGLLEEQIDVSDYKSGLYRVQVRERDEMLATQIVVAH